MMRRRRQGSVCGEEEERWRRRDGESRGTRSEECREEGGGRTELSGADGRIIRDNVGEERRGGEMRRKRIL